MHALIIDAHPLISMMLEDELREMGFASCAVAATQDAAVAAAIRLQPDLITASVRLAEGCGVEAARIICAEKSIPTVFIVSNPAEVGDASPKSIVISKPIGKDALQEAVEQVTQQMDDQRSPEAA